MSIIPVPPTTGAHVAVALLIAVNGLVCADDEGCEALSKTLEFNICNPA